MACKAIQIPAVETLSEQSKALCEVINNEPDLACVLISTSFLDQCLASLLEKYFIESSNTVQKLLDARGGTLGTFSSRSDLSYCLGLISKSLYQNLKIVGEIRNTFAHSHLNLSFGDADVAKLVNSLTFPSVLATVRIENGNAHHNSDPFGRFKEPRARFSVIIVLMVNRVLGTGLSTEHRPKQKENWS